MGETFLLEVLYKFILFLWNQEILKDIQEHVFSVALQLCC
jgi:hypothetical protein